MYTICEKCGRIYYQNVLRPGDWGGFPEECENILPDGTFCGGELYWLDEMIVPSVQALVDKGYKTENSCSAHFNDRSILHPYVQIALQIPTEYNGETLPLYKTSYVAELIYDDIINSVKKTECADGTKARFLYERSDVNVTLGQAHSTLFNFETGKDTANFYTITIETQYDFEADENRPKDDEDIVPYKFHAIAQLNENLYRYILDLPDYKKIFNSAMMLVCGKKEDYTEGRSK